MSSKLVIHILALLLLVYSAQSFIFVSWGDTKSGVSHFNKISAQAKSLNPQFTIYSGDLEERGFTSSGMQAWKSNNALFDITFPVRGNHDSSDLPGWQGFFSTADVAARVGAANYRFMAGNDDAVYSFDIGNSHFVGLDDLGDVGSISSGQLEWLDNDLSLAEKRGLQHAFLFFHGPIYCVSEHCSCTERLCSGTNAKMIKVMNNHSIITATFHGHEHTYAYTLVDNTRLASLRYPFRQFVTGAAGASPYACKANRCDYDMAAYGFALVNVTGLKVRVDIYKEGSTVIQQTIEFTKSGSASCSDGTADGRCSSGKPKYCLAGSLVDKCNECGCSSGTCLDDGSCGVGKCSDGTEEGYCSQDKPYRCVSGSLIKDCAICGCPTGECVSGTCQDSCTRHASYECHDGDLYWYDSCGKIEEKKAECQSGCSEDTCLQSCSGTCMGDCSSAGCLEVEGFCSSGNCCACPQRCDASCSTWSQGTCGTRTCKGEDCSVRTESKACGDTEKIRIYPIEDTFASKENPGAVFGTKKGLEVDGSPQKRVFMKFDLGDLGSSIMAARLRFYTYNKGYSGSVYDSQGSWSENTLSWKNMPAIGTSKIVGLRKKFKRSNWNSIALPPSYLSKGSVSMALISSKGDGMDFYSKDSGRNKPYLELTLESDTACIDKDHDTYGAAGSLGCLYNETDCDDAQSGVNPGSAEVCNGRDDDCDGNIDGIEKPCSASYKGACAQGSEKCLSGRWSGCPGPQQETCGNDMDEDCDGIDAACCAPSAEEVCNGRDDDCDGGIDEGLSRQCSLSRTGICAVGTEICMAGAWLGCPVPLADTCANGVDEDCDGSDDPCASGDTLSYEESDETFPNPERGFYDYGELSPDVTFSENRDTLVHAYVRLDDYREKDLPAALLNDVQAGFDRARQAKKKIILRFSYNLERYGEDATKARILSHLDQLKPLIQANSDIIYVMQAGFIGAWGEWHTSSNGLTNTADERDIVNKILWALPSSRSIAIRYPPARIHIFDSAEITSSTSYDSSPLSRTGFHNDCFLASHDDSGTYWDPTERFTVQYLKDYIGRETRFVPMGGETCQDMERVSCDSARAELAGMHWSYLAREWYVPALDTLKSGGCFEEIEKKLGYRFVMKNVTLPREVRSGSAFAFHAELANVGYAALYNERPAYLVFEDKSTLKRVQVRLQSVDPRRWEPVSARKINLIDEVVDISSLSPGEYKLYLWLPDASTRLQNIPEYSIRFANKDMWYSGYNLLDSSFVILQS